jgi:hypothetical protein
MKRSKAMKKTRKSNGTLETLLVIGLILIIPLFFVIRTAAERNTAPNTPIPSLPTEANAPTLPTAANTEEENAMKPKQPPACTFPLAEIKAEESKPEEYTFSESQVVLTAPESNLYHIAEWLPDNQQVLMTEELRSTSSQVGDGLQEAISLYNPETGEAKVYAIRHATSRMLPAWQPELNAVVYPIKNFHDINGKTLTFKLTLQIGVSYGNPDTAQLLEDNLPELSIIFKPGGDEMVYLSSKKIFKLDKSLKKLPPVSFDFTEWDYAKEKRGKSSLYYSAAWQPGTPMIFLYNDGGELQLGGYTFILNADTGQICKLDLGGWATIGRWSPDGRYLAVGRVATPHPSDLALLDSVTGDLITLDSPPQGIDGKFYISDFVWAPDNRHLLTRGNVYLSQGGTNGGNIQDAGLYLVNISNQNTYVGPYESTFAPPQDYNWAWSADGSKILMRCPTRELDRICLISVNQAGQ